MIYARLACGVTQGCNRMPRGTHCKVMKQLRESDSSSDREKRTGNVRICNVI